MDANTNRWYSMKDITEYLDVSRDAGLVWIEKHPMPATRIGRLWKCKVSDIDVWMKSRSTAKGL